jgi:hypothetical protein
MRGSLFLWEAHGFTHLFRCLLYSASLIQIGVTSVIAPLTTAWEICHLGLFCAPQTSISCDMEADSLQVMLNVFSTLNCSCCRWFIPLPISCPCSSLCNSCGFGMSQENYSTADHSPCSFFIVWIYLFLIFGGLDDDSPIWCFPPLLEWQVCATVPNFFPLKWGLANFFFFWAWAGLELQSSWS